MLPTSDPYLEIKNISKQFGAIVALNNVGLKLYPGEIHALLGENGAGKSTLIKIMTGIHQPDGGQILLEGNSVRFHNSAQAQVHRIAAIYQEPLVFPDLNIAENIFISHRRWNPLVNWFGLYHRAKAVLKKLDISLDVHAQARGLSLAAQQMVEIAKAISMNVRVLIMDEPTASLSAHEVEQLFKIMNNLQEQGVAILFISHRLEEVFNIADRITVFRDGEFISSKPTSEVTRESAIRDMVGRPMGNIFQRTPNETSEVVLSVRDLQHRGKYEGITFDLHAGEVLGFAGLVGAGRTEVALGLFGIEPAHSGQIHFNGQPIKIKSSQQAIKMGIAYVPEDRRQHGLILPMSITSNITLPIMRQYANELGVIQNHKEEEIAEEYRKKLSIRTPSTKLAAGKLSGGNQQKVVLSKWLNTVPKVLILDEPTRGIDVGAKEEVHRLIDELAAQGIAILIISSDLPEVMALSDRILVMREGRQMTVFDSQNTSQEEIITAAMGQLSLEGLSNNEDR